MRFEPALVIILWIPASDSPTIPSSGSAFRSRSSLRLRPTGSPRLQLRRQLAPPTEPPTLLSCSYDRLAPMVRTFRPSSSAASSACTAERASNSAVLLDVKLAFPAKLSGLIFDHTVSLRLRLDLRFCFPTALQLAPSFSRSASPSATFISLRRELRFRICLPARVFSLR